MSKPSSIRRRPIAEERQQFLEIIERHAERLGRLTEDLLSLSDLESGKIQIAPRPVDSGKLIQQVLEIFWERAAKKEIKLSHEISATCGKINGDPDRLQQLLINLVDNAVKFTPSGGKVTIRAAECQADNGARQIEISVADSGVGIPEKDLPRLTERFYRVDKARSRDLGGTGLGLAIVKHIVQAHRGELRITSELNKGTTIRVRLPIAENGAAANDGILFLCTGNSCRSQMAEGFARQLGSQRRENLQRGNQSKGRSPFGDPRHAGSWHRHFQPRLKGTRRDSLAANRSPNHSVRRRCRKLRHPAGWIQTHPLAVRPTPPRHRAQKQKSCPYSAPFAIRSENGSPLSIPSHKSFRFS